MTAAMPTPPLDSALPGLATLLDPAAMAALLTDGLLAHASDCPAVDGCRPVYVRYKPATSCLVAYQISLRDPATGALIETPGHVRVFADERALRRWQKRSFARLLDEAARLHPWPSWRRAGYLPTVNGLALLYPVDPVLKTLVPATSTAAVRHALAETMPDIASALGDSPPEPIRYKPERKVLLRYRCRDGDGGAIYGKLHDDERGARLVETGGALLRAGVSTAAPLGFLPVLRLLLHAEAPGRPLSDVLRHDPNDLSRWMEPLAALLARLHAAPTSELPAYRLADGAAALTASARQIGSVLPDLAIRAKHVAGIIIGRLDSVPDRGLTSHGDFYHDQSLVAGDGVVTLIDLDEARIAHPLLDVGNFLAHLRVATLLGGAVERAAATFCDAYFRVRPDDQATLPVFEAAALLHLAIGPFRRLEPDWPAGIARRLDLAEAALAEHQPDRRLAFHQPAGRPPPDDPTLPQLDSLTDRSVMSAVLERAGFAAPVAVHRIDLIRHKPGRRAILRYDLAIGPPAHHRNLRLYGKTFASERGPRVYEIARRITAARAFGPDVALPDPVAYLTELNLLLQQHVPGSPLSPMLLAGDADLSARVADASCAFHASGLDLGRRHDLEMELYPLRDRVARFAADYPALGTSAQTCLAHVESGRQAGWTWRWRPVHRDFYHDQLLITAGHPAVLAVLDLDDAAMAEPAVDVANFAAHLRLLALQSLADPDGLAPIAAAFLQRCHDRDPDLDPLLVRFLEGATLLRLATIHAPRRDGARIAPALLVLGERLLSTIDQPAPVRPDHAA